MKKVRFNFGSKAWPPLFFGAMFMVGCVLVFLPSKIQDNSSSDNGTTPATSSAQVVSEAVAASTGPEVLAAAEDPVGSGDSPNIARQPATQSSATGATSPSVPRDDSTAAVAIQIQPEGPTVNVVMVELSVNGNPLGKVSLAASGNQCDVLVAALANGVIDSLDMRYYPQFKTQGVYVINGQGSTDAIWWTFTVNGKSPPYGCSNVPVADGDKVNWKYIRS